MRAVLFLLALALCALPMHGLTRILVTLDDGSKVIVDNDSPWSDPHVASRVIAGDRSTVEECVFTTYRKGLIKAGDRVYINGNYMAWFDMTTNDGYIPFNPPYGGNWQRSGVLAGYWTMNPADGDFKYKLTGPAGCVHWPPNEIIPGSASPSGQQHWWDKYGPPTEYSMQVVSGANIYFFGHHFSRGHSSWQLVTEGIKDAAGVHYKTSGRLASIFQYRTDVTDNNDGNGVANYIQSELEYICKPDRITSIWKFRPNNANVVTNNLFVFVWLAYSQEMDGTACDPAAGDQFPSVYYRKYRYAKSSLPLVTNNPHAGPYAPGTSVQLNLGQICPNPLVNPLVLSDPVSAVGSGSWLAVGESPSLATSKPRLKWTNLGVPNAGTGIYTNPFEIAWHHLGFWNETNDGSVGMGVGRGPLFDPSQYLTLLAGKWHQTRFELQSVF